MRNIDINYGESIFEPYWDCGESYPDHQKYSLLNHYEIQKYNDTANIAEQWAGIRMGIFNKSNLPEDIRITAKCDIDVSRYDYFRFFGGIPKDSVLTAELEIDGEIQKISMEGRGVNDEYTGDIHGKRMTSFALVFKSTEDRLSALLYYAGFGNKERVKYMESIIPDYDDKWEGCFVENPEIKTSTQIYFDDEELVEIRKRANEFPFSKVMDRLRKQAQEDMNIIPEKDIGYLTPGIDKRWCVKRELNKVDTTKDTMSNLAFVGLVDKNIDMLRMACRMALSVAHNQHWCESIMGVFPGATWHHRSFTEEGMLKSCSDVLDWAGSLLTWHGKHIILDAIIMKGLPRMESDFMTVDYIRHMNQGIVFNSGRLPALITCEKTYPRYAKRVEEAEQDMFEMIDNYLCDDGGNPEGPSYWNYTLGKSLPTLYMIAKRHKKPLWDILPQKIKESVDYALVMMSDCDDGTLTLPINDSHGGMNDYFIMMLYSQYDERWQYIYQKALNKELPTRRELLYLDVKSDKKPQAMYEEGIIEKPISGHISVRRKFNDGIAHLHTVSGKPYFGHSHGDKGSFILELEREPIFIDRGVCSYDIAYKEIEHTEMHNCFAPYDEGMSITQPINDVEGGKVIKSALDGEKYEYKTELKNAWDNGMFDSLTREIVSESSDEYIIIDSMKAQDEKKMCFRLNTYGDIMLEDDRAVIKTENHICYVYFDTDNIADIKAGEYGHDHILKKVNQLGIYYKPSKEMKIKTIIKCENI